MRCYILAMTEAVMILGVDLLLFFFAFWKEYDMINTQNKMEGYTCWIIFVSVALYRR